MTSPLNILHLEDDRNDAELVRMALEADGLVCEITHVDTRPDFLAAVERGGFAVILADYSLPTYDGLSALDVAREQCPEVPFIFVSGALGEEVAIETLKNGATDYVLKTKLSLLAAAVRRARREAEEHAARQQAEAALRASQAMFQELFGSAPDAIVVVNHAGRILRVNQQVESMFGYGPEELRGQPVEMLLPERFRPRHEAHRTSYVAAPRRRTMGADLELYGRRKDGSEFPVDIMLGPLEANGDIAVLGIVRDITERKQAEAELAAKNEELRAMTQQLWQTAKLATMGELAASIAHELNNPLGTVGLRIESLAAQIPPDDPMHRELNVMEQEVDRMGALVANLLQFSRRGAQQISTLDVPEEIDRTLELIHYHLRQRQVAVVRDFTPDLPLIQADRQHLRQLFLNLFANAADAMPEGGTLTLRVSAVEKQVLIEVTDTGVGIAPGDLRKVTEPFFTTKPEGKGTGLGLAICRRVAQEHGGTLTIASAGPGQGATARVTLPIHNNTNGRALKAV
jgi:PAS domain S-box-containing protein